MWKNYLTIALRTLRKQPGYTFINITGLAVGLACFVLILLYTRYEQSYDQHFPDADRVYRVAKDNVDGGFKGDTRFTVTPAGVANALRQSFPETEAATLFSNWPIRVGHEQNSFYEMTVFADSFFFDVFGFEPVAGDLATALDAPGSVVLTESVARKLFGNRDPLGQFVQADDTVITVRAVIADVPDNTHFTFGLVRPVREGYTDFESKQNQWGNSSFKTYFKARPGARMNGFAEKITAYAKAAFEKADEDWEWKSFFFLQPLTDIHLRSQINFELQPNGDIRYVYLFLAIGFIILLIGCINYVNLATARAARRAREIGVRKAVGAYQGQLVRQFLFEALLTTVFAFALALVLAYALLPAFSTLVDRSLHFGMLADSGWLVALLGLAVAVALGAGGYPALVLAGTKAVDVLKGQATTHGHGGLLRRMLVVTQFAAAIALLISGVVIYQQLDFMSSKKLGFDREHVIALRLRGEGRTNAASMRQELLRHARIQEVAFSPYHPYQVGSSSTVDNWEGNAEEQEMETYMLATSATYLDVFQIPVIAGAPLRADSDDEEFLVNEAAVRGMGWTPEEAIGRQFRCDDCRIVGVVQDFHFQPLHLPITPLMISPVGDNPWYHARAFVRVAPGPMPEVIDQLRETHAQFAPGEPFDYEFVDEGYDALYKDEQRFGQAVGAFTGLALLIACLGLFGLAAYMAQRRTKEIGVRKVLGASMPSLLTLLSKEFAVLVVVAFAVAAPIAWFFTQRWLQDFAFRVEVGPGLFVLAGVAALLVALLTVSYQAFKVANANPAEVLRYE